MPPPRRTAARTRDAGRTKRDKAATIYSDQQTDLDGLARELQDARSVRDERITANTLIRVALDGLIEHADRLYGDTEEQLRASWLEFLSEQAEVAGTEEGEGDEDLTSDESHK